MACIFLRKAATSLATPFIFSTRSSASQSALCCSMYWIPSSVKLSNICAASSVSTVLRSSASLSSLLSILSSTASMRTYGLSRVRISATILSLMMRSMLTSIGSPSSASRGASSSSSVSAALRFFFGGIDGSCTLACSVRASRKSTMSSSSARASRISDRTSSRIVGPSSAAPRMISSFSLFHASRCRFLTSRSSSSTISSWCSSSSVTHCSSRAYMTAL
mmetsp:Transcript_7942/g.19786  ORF Transcript_7942/g.19786 Transcript_7942/m.19786 type:complete len:220 (-) Transcript_7942:555-1214(-)